MNPDGCWGHKAAEAVEHPPYNESRPYPSRNPEPKRCRGGHGGIAKGARFSPSFVVSGDVVDRLALPSDAVLDLRLR